MDSDPNIEVVLEEDGTRVAEDEFLLHLEGHTKLMILKSNTQWTVKPGQLGEVHAEHQEMNIQNGWDFKINLTLYLSLIFVYLIFFNSVKFKQVQRSMLDEDETGYFVCRFHPKFPILAFAGFSSEVMLLQAESCGIQFSNWTESHQFALHSHFPKQISTLEWNASLSLI